MLTTQCRMHPILLNSLASTKTASKMVARLRSDHRLQAFSADWDRPMAFVPVEGVEDTDEEEKAGSIG